MLKKYGNWALGYTIAALVCGVYYREITKMTGFYSGKTALSVVHLHLIALGAFMMLFIALMIKNFALNKAPSFNKAFVVYTIGLLAVVTFFLIKGTMVVLGINAPMPVSILLGLSHLTLGVGITWIVVLMRNALGGKYSAE